MLLVTLHHNYIYFIHLVYDIDIKKELKELQLGSCLALQHNYFLLGIISSICSRNMALHVMFVVSDIININFHQGLFL